MVFFIWGVSHFSRKIVVRTEVIWSLMWARYPRWSSCTCLMSQCSTGTSSHSSVAWASLYGNLTPQQARNRKYQSSYKLAPELGELHFYRMLWFNTAPSQPRLERVGEYTPSLLRDGMHLQRRYGLMAAVFEHNTQQGTFDFWNYYKRGKGWKFIPYGYVHTSMNYECLKFKSSLL